MNTQPAEVAETTGSGLRARLRETGEPDARHVARSTGQRSKERGGPHNFRWRLRNAGGRSREGHK